MHTLTLQQANRIITAALQKARILNLAPLAVVVLDAAGQIKALQREDRATAFRIDIATAKAWGAVSMGMSSRRLGDVASQRPVFMNSLINMAEGKVMPVPGGLLLRDMDGCILGAVGVSGDVSDQDECCALAGIEAAGLVAG
ncbi:MAG: GlcG/HbpS family heme-binding protein [Gammaproteobacteria bacterium]